MLLWLLAAVAAVAVALRAGAVKEWGVWGAPQTHAQREAALLATGAWIAHRAATKPPIECPTRNRRVAPAADGGATSVASWITSATSACQPPRS